MKTKSSSKRRFRPGHFIRFLVIVAGAVVMIFPLLWMLTIALKKNQEVFKIPPEWFPHQFQWSNFVKGTEIINFWHLFANSMIISIIAILGQVTASVFVGYGISRIRFPGRKLWFYLFIGSMMLPGVVGLLPTFYIFKALGMYNTWFPVILPAIFGNPFFIFLARQYLSSIPKSYDEAAMLDGATHLQILKNVIVPMSKPMIVTMIIMSFQMNWNDYLTPLVYLQSEKLWTLPLGIASYISKYATSWNLFMAADLLYMLPMLLLFFFAQKYFMEGLGSLNSTGIKS